MGRVEQGLAPTRRRRLCRRSREFPSTLGIVATADTKKRADLRCFLKNDRVSTAKTGRRPRGRRYCMIDMYRKLFSLPDRRERRQFYVVCAMILVMGLFDMAGVAVILPFLRVVTDPSIIESSTRLSAIYDWFAPSSMQNFLVFLGGIVLAVL